MAEIAVTNTSSAVLSIRLDDGSAWTLLPGIETWMEQSLISRWCAQNGAFQDLLSWPGKPSFGSDPFVSESSTATVISQ